MGILPLFSRRARISHAEKFFWGMSGVTFTGKSGIKGKSNMDSTALAIRKSSELKKHVGAIHSLNRLSLVERKIANALLYNAYDNLLTQSKHQIHISQLCQLIGYDSNDYKTIRKALISLISTVIEWNLIGKDTEDNEWVASAMISDASIKGSVCTYSYGERMRELLYHPELYGRVNMQVQARFESGYGLALYENCIRYQNINQTPRFELALFRKLMGVEDGKYPIFRDFKRRVVDIAVNEVNRHAPINIEAKFNRVGQKVESIQFIINKAEESPDENNEPDSVEKTLADRLQENFGFTANQIELTLAQYEEKYILEKIAVIESSSSYRSGKIANLSRYLEKALAENYQFPKSSQDNIIKLKKKKEENGNLLKLSEERVSEYRGYQNKAIFTQYDQSNKSGKAQILKEFEQYISKSIYYKLYATNGLENALVRERFYEFIRTNRPEFMASIMTYEEFIKSKQE